MLIQRRRDSADLGAILRKTPVCNLNISPAPGENFPAAPMAASPRDFRPRAFHHPRPPTDGWKSSAVWSSVGPRLSINAFLRYHTPKILRARRFPHFFLSHARHITTLILSKSEESRGKRERKTDRLCPAANYVSVHASRRRVRFREDGL